MKAPTKLYKAIRMALKDQKQAEEHLMTEVRMNDWHTPRGKGCSMCFAGAVMHFSLECSLEHAHEPEDFGKDWKNVFFALDDIRQGNVWEAFIYMGIKNNETLSELEALLRDIDYNLDKEDFKKKLNLAADILEEENL